MSVSMLIWFHTIFVTHTQSYLNTQMETSIHPENVLERLSLTMCLSPSSLSVIVLHISIKCFHYAGLRAALFSCRLICCFLSGKPGLLHIAALCRSSPGFGS